MKALIVVNGEPPPQPLLVERARECDFIIAADGGYTALAKADIKPDIVVGDFDSLDAEGLAGDFEILQAPREKNDTDAFLAVEYAIGRGADEIVMLGATGGRVDHLLSNLMLLRWAGEKDVVLEMEDATQIIGIYGGDFEIEGKKGQTVSIIPANEAVIVSAKGLYYPLDELMLKNDRPRGISNVFRGDTAHLHSTGPVLVIKIKEG